MTLLKNIRESLLFLIASRETLMLFTEDDEIKDFLKNEATDYEILSLLIDGVFPEEKYNLDEEVRLFDILNEQTLLVESVFAEVFGADLIEPMKKLHSPYPLSSTKPNMDHQLKYLEEKPLSKAAQLQLQRSRERLKRARELAKSKELAKAAEKGKEVVAKTAEKAKGVVKKVVPGKKKPVKDVLPAGWGDAGAGAKPAVGTTKTHGDVIKAAQSGLKTKLDAIGKAATSAGQAISQAIKGASPEQLAIGGGALAALALYGSYKTYKRFLGKAARACKGKKGADKTVCMKNYKIAAYNGQIKDLQAASKGCSKSKNPKQCVGKINQKIQKLKTKILKAK